MAHARTLIDAGNFDDSTEWSEPGTWRSTPEASEDTRKRYAFPYSDFTEVNRAALVRAKQRGAPNGHTEIEEAAAELPRYLDEKRSSQGPTVLCS